MEAVKGYVAYIPDKEYTDPWMHGRMPDFTFGETPDEAVEKML
jgi:hypothetical protein